jgi:hypothetical protein
MLGSSLRRLPRKDCERPCRRLRPMGESSSSSSSECSGPLGVRGSCMLPSLCCGKRNDLLKRPRRSNMKESRSSSAMLPVGLSALPTDTVREARRPADWTELDRELSRVRSRLVSGVKSTSRISVMPLGTAAGMGLLTRVLDSRSRCLINDCRRVAVAAVLSFTELNSARLRLFRCGEPCPTQVVPEELHASARAGVGASSTRGNSSIHSNLPPNDNIVTTATRSQTHTAALHDR